ncbi:MAG: SMI1/KNR4 family protein [Isosphaeraceae bacterium]
MSFLRDWMSYRTFFDASDYYTGPPFDDAAVARSEAVLGYKLPASYLRLLRVKNGGVPRRQCFPVSGDYWPEDHVRIVTLFGIGGEWGVDSAQFGSRKMIAQGGFPEIGVFLGWTPTAGHDGFLLDYSGCGPQGEPRVTFADPEGEYTEVLAPDFATFFRKLAARPR